MQKPQAKSAAYGPWLVGLGAALWGTESAWRIPLNELFDAEVIVFWEHILILLMFLPILLPNLGELRKVDLRTWGFLGFSGFAGSAADSFALFARFESKLEQYRGNLERSAVELAKEKSDDAEYQSAH